MTKINKIKQFIIENKPTRKEIVTFIVVDVNNLCTAQEYDHRDWFAYYATNFTKWKSNGQTQIDSNGRYSITSAGLKCDKGLYSLPDSIKIQRLENLVKALRKQVNDLQEANWDWHSEKGNSVEEIVIPKINKENEYILYAIKKLIESINI